MSRVTYIAGVGVAVAWLLSFTETREAMILAEFRVFVPLSFMAGLVGLVRLLSKRYTGLADLYAGLFWACLLTMAWGLDAGRAWVRRTLSAVGFPDAEALESNNVRVLAAALLVLAGIMFWRWAMRWPIFRRWHGWHLTGGVPWSVLLLAWVTFAVFGEAYIERAIVAIFWR